MKVEHLYKVYGRGTTAPIYVAAECQQQAVDMAATMHNIEDSYQLAVDYVSEVLTRKPQYHETEESVS